MSKPEVYKEKGINKSVIMTAYTNSEGGRDAKY